MKRLPYGLTDFLTLVQEDYYIFDKSAYIRTVEEQNAFVLLVRPRRMGKSMFTNMLITYYDINNKDKFSQIFRNLAIGKNPTPLASKFLVIKLDFSHLRCNIDDLEKDFTTYCFSQLRDFLDRYERFYTLQEQERILKSPSEKDAFLNLYNISKRKGLDVYIFVDEYDNFTNNVLAARGVEAHRAITHGEGFYRDFFKIFKGTFPRIFMTGVTPVSYDDLTSGFSIADVVGLEPQFNQAIGVTETELREMIEYYRSEGCIQRETDVIINEMKPWYDNFCFSEDSYGIESTIYNTDMVLYYMRPVIMRDQPPKEMLDEAACTDTTKLDYLVMSEDIENRNERISIIEEICSKGFTTGTVEKLFYASDVGKEKNFKSMLFYFGTLTFGGWDENGFSKLIVPNRNMGELYLKYMLKVVEGQGLKLNGTQKRLDNAIKEAALDGKWQPLSEVIDNIYHDYTSLRNSIHGEPDVQGFIRGLLCLNPFFDVWPELEVGGGFSDILLVPKINSRTAARYSYLIELKYAHANGKNNSELIKQACHQIERYSKDIHLKNNNLLGNTPLICLYWILSPSAPIIAEQYNP